MSTNFLKQWAISGLLALTWVLANAQGAPPIGTWTASAAATEVALLTAKFSDEERAKALTAFGLGGGLVWGLVYQFEGDRLSIEPRGPRVEKPQGWQYSVKQRGVGRWSYVLEREGDMESDLVTVVAHATGELSITHQGTPELSFIRWKRVDPKNVEALFSMDTGRLEELRLSLPPISRLLQ